MSPEKGGVLRARNIGGRRAGLALLFSGAMLAVPLVLLNGQTDAAHPSGRTTGSRAAPTGLLHVGAVPASDEIALVRFSDQRMAATSTAGTPTATAPPPTATTVPAASASGGATWYTETSAGGCASPWLPRGTELTVTNDATGATTTCLVDDREADNPGRVVDMSYTTFSEIGDPSTGVLTVTITW
jgi:hypothetical protein